MKLLGHVSLIRDFFVGNFLEEDRLGASKVVTFFKIVNSKLCENTSIFKYAQERNEHNYVKQTEMFEQVQSAGPLRNGDPTFHVFQLSMKFLHFISPRTSAWHI